MEPAALLALAGSAALLTVFYIPRWPMLPEGFTFSNSTVDACMKSFGPCAENK